jgi:hypothetical protein
MNELKSKINDELQKRVEFIGASLVFNSIGIQLNDLYPIFQKMSEPSYENYINPLKPLFENDEDFNKIKNFFIKVDADIYNSLKIKDKDILLAIDENIKKEIKSNN